MSFVRLIIAVLLFASMSWTAVHAATPVSKEDANAFYAQCMSTPDDRLSQDTKNEFCACKSVHMMQTMSAEDVKTMRESNSAGRVMLNKALIAVHGPCLSGPIAEMHYNKCADDPRVTLAGQNIDRGAVCACMSAKVGEWLEQAGPDVMTQTIAQDPFVTDPLEPVMQSIPYKKEEYEIMLDCFQTVLTGR